MLIFISNTEIAQLGLKTIYQIRIVNIMAVGVLAITIILADAHGIELVPVTWLCTT